MDVLNPEESFVQREIGSQADTWTLVRIAAVVAIIHLLTNGRYGFHRDELQFLSDARHLDWGFVAYPPITPSRKPNKSTLAKFLLGLSTQYSTRPRANKNAIANNHHGSTPSRTWRRLRPCSGATRTG